jgi:drug/metabolite transporter (DMT)-like permease
MTPPQRLVGVALIAVSAASFGAMAILARLAYDSGADPTAVLFLRFAMAGAVMAAIMRLRGDPWPRGRLLAGLAAMGGLGYVGQSFSYFTALTMASAGLVALLLYLYPVMVTVLAALVLHERVTPVKAAALAMALGGSAMTVGPEVGGGRLGGILLGVAAPAIYSVYILVGSRLTPQAGSIPSSAVIMLAAAVVFGVLFAVQGPALPGTVAGWAAVVAISLVCTVLAIVTFFAGLARVGPADAATLSTLEPVVTLVLAAAVLGERFGAMQLVGGVLILAAVLVLARAAAPRPTPVAPTGMAEPRPGRR